MKKQTLFLLKLLGFWLLLFLFQRFLFCFHFFGDFEGDYGALFQVPFRALTLDFSAFAYIMAIAMLMGLASFFSQKEKFLSVLNKIILFYVVLIAVISALIMSGEITTYIEWKTKLSPRIYTHLVNPKEVFRTASLSYTLWFVFYFMLQLGFIYLIYFRWFKKNKIHPSEKSASWLRKAGFGLGYFLTMSFAFVLFMRGGFQQIPVSTTSAYFSTTQIVNDVTVNPVWNFIHMTYLHFKVDLSVYYNRLSPEEQRKELDHLFGTENKNTVSILNGNTPDIIFITFEGWSAQLLERLGGEPGITPNFTNACDEGLLFTEIYATSGTSETGNSSIMSGYQTISGTSISTQSAKCRKLPSINQSLATKGYKSFYAFGGDLSYGNIGGYLTDIGFDRIVDEDELDLQPSGKLGIHDEAMFPYFLSEVKKAKSPYFYTLFTQSTHAPYDMPAEPYPAYDGDAYVTSLNYADQHLGLFLEEIKQLPNFDNTLVVFISDHGRTHLTNENTYAEDYFHIPLLFWGGALKKEFRGEQVNKVGSQADLAKTLLNQLGLPSNEFLWSKDLLDPTTPEWAICTSTLSYGWKNKDGYTVYDMINDNLIDSPYSNQKQIDSVIYLCRAVLESIYDEYEDL